MKSSYVCIWPSNKGEIDCNAEMGVFGSEISDSGRHTAFAYPDIWIPVEIINLDYTQELIGHISL